MIGANISPMSMFTGGGNENFQRGMMIGNANSPFSTVNEAMRATVDKYNAHLSAQAAQADKLEQIKAEGVASHPFMYNADGTPKTGGMGGLTDANGPKITKDPTTGKFFYGNDSLNTTTGQVNTSWTPVTNSPPTDEKKIMENSIYAAVNAGMQGQDNPIVQGASGAVADATGQQSRPIDAKTASTFLKQAGGDKNKARMMAKQAGYSF